MIKYKQNRKLIKVICDGCQIEFEKPESEYKRNLSFNRRNFCSRTCLGKNNNLHLRNYSFDLSAYKVCRIKDENSFFRYYLKNARNRFKKSNLTLKDLSDLWNVQNGICPYSGIQLLLSSHGNIIKNPIYAASLDRIDSNKGYEVGNVQWVSRSINYMKNNMTHDQTIELCKLIAKNYIDVI